MVKFLVSRQFVLTIIVSLTIFSISIISVVALSATTSNDSRSVYGCFSAQNYLKNVQRPKDLRARVDRLQAYQYIGQRLDIFTQRLENNSQPKAQDLRRQLDKLKLEVDDFKVKYENYDEARDQLVSIENCEANTSKFKTLLSSLRLERKRLNQSVKLIDDRLRINMSGQLEDLQDILDAQEQSRSSS